MRDYYQNHYMGIFFNMPEDKLIKTVAENFLAKADSPLLNVLNPTFIEGCVDEFIQNQTVELDMDDLPENQDGWTKPSRKNRRKHDKKASKRKGNAKRFRDRSRKCAHEGHMVKVYHRGMAGDWSVRGRRLEEAGAISTANSHKIVRDFIRFDTIDGQDETRSFKCEDGTTISCTMSQDAWFAPVWDKENAKYTSVQTEWDEAESRMGVSESESDDLDFDSRDYIDYDFDDDDDDEIIDEPAPTPNKKSSYDTSEFTAMELAQMSMKLACATPDQRAWIREFMKTL